MSFYLKELNLKGPFKPKSVFLAEGFGEIGFFEAVLNKQKRDPKDNVIFCFQGHGNLKGYLGGLVNEDNFNEVKRIGIMLDSEGDYSNRVTIVTNHLHNAGIASLTKSDIEKVVSARGREIAVFISPGGKANGRIENIIKKEIAGTPIFKCIGGLDACVKGASGAALDEKSEVRIYMSIVAPSSDGVRTGFIKGHLNINHSAYDVPRKLFSTITS